ncbi:protein kinase domain-containing protein [Vibrio sinaloensis]|uniref:protein kinase domain-containing protein n=1 Tax=Photobacterium sp. (strain ATCC 43367) TaxID=379097 RepID=UPI00057CDA58|nr:protein kinase [Vibrio sinaloensis]KHT50064.1 hypothetical protein RJ46_07445 [Vibrio sinaloensis]
MTKKEKSTITLDGTTLSIDGHVVTIPYYVVLDELGQGANATVFRAYDVNLKRNVAIKVWNSRGRSRAQDESIKIASLKHPLVVETYLYSSIDGYPYAVMELVEGESGKKWLSTSPSLEEKVTFWNLYSEALQAVYAGGFNHGDPHLGNVLVYRDGNSNIQIKLADAGTSDFRGDKHKLMLRESRILLEVVGKVFSDYDFNSLWINVKTTAHLDWLKALDNLVEFINIIELGLTYDWKSHYATKLVDLVYDTPLFKLDDMIRLINEKAHISGRFKLYLNRRLQNSERDNTDDHLFELTDVTLERYAEIQSPYISAIKAS